MFGLSRKISQRENVEIRCVSPLQRSTFVVFDTILNSYEGSMSATHRAEEVDRFNRKENVKYMLLSLKAGGVGLNLNKYV
jgi:hypothetical protein